MGCCLTCLNSCCCTQAGLRCHSVVSICGFVYFGLMFVMFERQKDFFEFEIPDEQGTKWALLAVAAIWLALFFVTIIKLTSALSVKEPPENKRRVTVLEVRNDREQREREREGESAQLLRQRGGTE